MCYITCNEYDFNNQNKTELEILTRMRNEKNKTKIIKAPTATTKFRPVSLIKWPITASHTRHHQQQH